METTDKEKAQNLGVTGGLEGICYICNAPTTRGCRTCGGSVCDNHLKGEVCDNCARGLQG